MYESYRVLRKFQWRGFVFAPPGKCTCECNQDESRRTLNGCTGVVGTGCTCPDCGYCGCGIKADQYGGDIWIVEENHPRKMYILARRFANYDPALPSGDELVANPAFARLVQDPGLRREQPIPVNV